jgi:hypothetical protein
MAVHMMMIMSLPYWGNSNWCACYYKEIWAQFTEISFKFVCVLQGNIGAIHWTISLIFMKFTQFYS